ncbi:hypothetical protein KY358_02925 [Candidatus Woesearchaeota archaeon]|nr:hypothetical protein [Candidatus Woesearchaeota archaeon]
MRYGKLPKNHSERFRILERKEKRTYGTVDAIWQKYTSTYSRPSGEDSFTLLNKAVVEIIENEITDKEIKRLIEE